MFSWNEIRRSPSHVALLVAFVGSAVVAASPAAAAPPAPVIERQRLPAQTMVRQSLAPQKAMSGASVMPTPALAPVGKDPELTTGLLPVALVIRVAPFGDIYVDGERVATASMHTRVFRHPGQHRIEVRHPLAAAETRVVTLVDQDAATEVRIRLQPKPAQFVVTADEDFTASVGDTLLQGRKGIATALFIPMNQWAGIATTEVVLTSKSGRTVRVPLSVRAGARLSQRVRFADAKPITRRPTATVDPAMAW